MDKPIISGVFKTNSLSVIGLDIGSYSVKSVEVVLAGGAIQLRRVFVFPYDRAKPGELDRVLKHIFDPSQGRPARVRISLSSGSSLLIRRIKLPMMTVTELKGAIVYEAEGHIPFPVEECLLDFQIIGQDAQSKTMHVVLVAVKNVFIQERLKLLESAGLVPEIIDVDIFCLLNAFEALGDDGGHKSYGILNIGHEKSSFAIVHEKQPFFVREIPIGGLDVSRSLATAKGVSLEEADTMKVERPQGSEETLKQATAQGFEVLLDEMRSSIDFFENETGEELKQIWMSGGGALSYNAAAFLTSELGRPVALWDNLKKMDVFGEVDQDYLREHSYELNVALGMVLRGVEAKK